MGVRARSRARGADRSTLSQRIIKLFSTGTPGLTFDPYDYSTLFQDSAGTTPVTAVEQPVGLMLDKHLGLIPSTKSAHLSGVTGTYVSTPNSVASSITGDIDIRVKAALDDWTPVQEQALVAKYSTAGLRGYKLSVAITTGVLALYWSNDGTAIITKSSTVAPTVANFATLHVRATLDVDNGAGGNTVTFYTSSNGIDWTQLGDAVVTAGTTSLVNNGVAVNIGAHAEGGGAPGLANVFGKIYSAHVYNGIAGTLALDFKATDYVSGATLTSSTTGEVYTLNGSAHIAPDGNHAIQATSGNRPTLSARKNLLLATATLATQNVTTTAIPYTLQFTGTGTIALSGTSVAGPLIGGGTLTFTPTAGTLTLTVTGSVTLAQLETGSTATRYQAVVTATDYDTVGFPRYLKSNGVNTSMSVPSLDLSTTDKVFVCAGVRKLSDAAVGILLEHSVSVGANNGSFFITAPSTIAAPDYRFASKGTLQSNSTATTYTSPITNVISCIGDIVGNSAIIRANGVQITEATADQGTGNFGSYPFYLFARAGTSIFFLGNFYGMTVVGKTLAPTEIATVESFTNSRTGGVY